MTEYDYRKQVKRNSRVAVLYLGILTLGLTMASCQGMRKATERDCYVSHIQKACEAIK